MAMFDESPLLCSGLFVFAGGRVNARYFFSGKMRSDRS
jgi:hypothetical protein